jgi:hypothetical protein
MEVSRLQSKIHLTTLMVYVIVSSRSLLIDNVISHQ